MTVMHSEQNASDTEPVHYLQIWVRPDRQRLEPRDEQRAFPASERRGRLTLLASQDGREGSVTIHQDVGLCSALLDAGDRTSLALRNGRHAWVQVARGAVRLNDNPVAAGDGVALSEESAVELEATAPSEALLFDLA